MNQQIILIDEPLERDKRVLNILKQYHNYAIVDCSAYNVKISIVHKIYKYFLLFSNLYSLVFYWNILYKKYQLKPRDFFTGLNKSIHIELKSKLIAKEILQQYQNIKIIHANDMLCGLVAKEMKNHLNISLIYDAHEVEFQRNRKNGFLRVVYDILLEKKIINIAQKVIVVNKPIKKLYMDIYNIPESKIIIVDNNHFTPLIGYALNCFEVETKDVAITYIGGGIFGRKLESLAKDASQTDIKIYGFFLTNIPTVAYEYKWYIGAKNYLPELLELIQKVHLAMWCCTDDICLSYKLSLPNKFFQAMAVGIPVIVYKDTYLADIVEKYNLGYIYTDDNFQNIELLLKDTKKYYFLLESIVLFQKKLFNNGLEL